MIWGDKKIHSSLQVEDEIILKQTEWNSKIALLFWKSAGWIKSSPFEFTQNSRILSIFRSKFSPVEENPCNRKLRKIIKY